MIRKLISLLCPLLLAAGWIQQASSSQPAAKPRLGSGELTGTLDDGYDKAVTYDARGKMTGLTVKIGSEYQCYFFTTPTTTVAGGPLMKGQRVRVAYRNLVSSEMDQGYFFTGKAATISVISGSVSAGQSTARQSQSSPTPAVKTVVGTYVSEDSGSGAGNITLMVDGRAMSFFWTRGTKFNNVANNEQAHAKGAEWRVTYSESTSRDQDPFLITATFTGRVLIPQSSGANKSDAGARLPRLIVVLFTGARNREDSDSGMKALLNSIKSDDALKETIGAVFTFYDPSRGFSPTAPYLSTLRNFRLPHETAVDWVSDQRPRPGDKIVLIGHSYGGNRARLFGGDLLLKGLRADALITIDPID